jgi:hypothetical protein
MPLAVTSLPPTGAAVVTWQAEPDAFGWPHPSNASYQPFGFPGQVEAAETAAQVWDPACYPSCASGHRWTA